MDFSVLGPLQVSRDAEPVYLGGPGKPRLLLAILLAHPGRAVPIDTLVGGLWTARPPASARRNLHQYVHRLRGFLQAQRITARDGGYELTPQPADTFDAALFRELARQGSDSFAA